MNDFTYPHRNGETTPPEVGANEFTYYWFDGVAHQEDWTSKGNLIVVTNKRTDRVIGLVVVAMLINMKHPQKTPEGHYVHDCPLMIAEPETGGYELANCEGRWWGPVHVPRLSDDMLPSMAAVEDYETFKRFHA